MVILQLILFSSGAFLFRTFGGFLHVPTTQINCLTGAIIRETHIPNIYLKVLGNEKNGGSGRSQMLGYGAGP
jgi:hypothetical protein